MNSPQHSAGHDEVAWRARASRHADCNELRAQLFGTDVFANIDSRPKLHTLGLQLREAKV